MTCNMTSGVCAETGCENKTCPAGQVCVGGNCQDGCQGVTCPGGQQCRDGRCKMVGQPAGTSTGSGGAGGFSILGTGGQGGTTGSGATTEPGQRRHLLHRLRRHDWTEGRDRHLQVETEARGGRHRAPLLAGLDRHRVPPGASRLRARTPKVICRGETAVGVISLLLLATPVAPRGRRTAATAAAAPASAARPSYNLTVDATVTGAAIAAWIGVGSVS